MRKNIKNFERCIDIYDYNEPKILSRDGLSLHDYIKRHCYQNSLLKQLYDSGEFLDSDLLYLFKNNTLRRLGFSPKRGHKKLKEFHYRRLIGWQLYQIIEETINEMIYSNTNNFNEFADVENIEFGEPNLFYTEGADTNFRI